MPATQQSRATRQAQQRQQNPDGHPIGRAQGKGTVQWQVQGRLRFDPLYDSGFKIETALIAAELPGMRTSAFAALQDRMRHGVWQCRSHVCRGGNVRDLIAALLASQPEAVAGAGTFDDAKNFRWVRS